MIAATCDAYDRVLGPAAHQTASSASPALRAYRHEIPQRERDERTLARAD